MTVLANGLCPERCQRPSRAVRPFDGLRSRALQTLLGQRRQPSMAPKSLGDEFNVINSCMLVRSLMSFPSYL